MIHQRYINRRQYNVACIKKGGKNTKIVLNKYDAKLCEKGAEAGPELGWRIIRGGFLR